MGLFDTLAIDVKCPYCGTLLSEWQTKDLSNTMGYFYIGQNLEQICNKEKVRAVEYCHNCNEFIYAIVIIDDGYLCGLKLIRE